MVLTPEMIKWNKMIEEQRKKDKNKTFNEEIRVDVQEDIRDLYNNLKKNLLNVGKDIKIVQQKKYIAFKVRSSFVDVEILKSYIKCHINMKKGTLKDPNERTRDMSNLGHFGTGDYEIILKSIEEIPYFIDLAKQAYDKNS